MDYNNLRRYIPVLRKVLVGKQVFVNIQKPYTNSVSWSIGISKEMISQLNHSKCTITKIDADTLFDVIMVQLCTDLDCCSSGWWWALEDIEFNNLTKEQNDTT
jgi:hypothetical protein